MKTGRCLKFRRWPTRSLRTLDSRSMRPPRRLIIVSALDNLGKGAAGQAVQNMNLMFGFPQELGLV